MYGEWRGGLASFCWGDGDEAEAEEEDDMKAAVAPSLGEKEEEEDDDECILLLLPVGRVGRKAATPGRDGGAIRRR